MSDPWRIEGSHAAPPRVTVFGHLIRMRREELGLTQKDVARALGYMDPAPLNKIEKGAQVLDWKSYSQSLIDVLQVDPAKFREVYELDLVMKRRQAEREAMK